LSELKINFCILESEASSTRDVYINIGYRLIERFFVIEEKNDIDEFGQA